MLEVTPIEIHLSSALNREEPVKGYFHSEFKRVKNYLFEIDGEKRMFTIMREGNYLLPDSMILSNTEFDKIRNLKELSLTELQSLECGKRSSCSLLGLSLEKFTRQGLEQKLCQIDEFIANSEKKTDFARLPIRYANQLGVFIRGMMEHDKNIIENSFLSLIGAGKGLTPSADDAVIGSLAGILFGLTLKEEQDTYLERIKIVLPHLREKKLTTQISEKYLKCACDGDFSKAVGNLIHALAGEECGDFTKNLMQISETGYSSGMDMLYGLQKTLHEIWQNRKGEEWKAQL